MALRKPLVIVSGLSSQLPPGDTIEGAAVASTAIAGSGLTGGGPIGSDFTYQIMLAANPSGLIFVQPSSGIAYDGTALVSGNTGIASGNAAIQRTIDMGLGNLSGVTVGAYGGIVDQAVITFSGGAFRPQPAAAGGTSFDDIFGIA
tara:strand:+ start:2492 stop:2929 length:438 start_codon:yes stop_codon:yes gene_type:complete